MKKIYIYNVLAIVLLMVVSVDIAAQEVDTEELVVENTVFDSKKYNKWTNSTNFRKGAKEMSAATENDDFKKAVRFFEKEIKQHPRNGYALCNIALCNSTIAQSSLNQLIYNILFESGLEESQMDSVYHQGTISIQKQMADAATTLEKGITLIPTTDKATRCEAYLECAKLFNMCDRDSAEIVGCLQKAVKEHPCFDSYHKILEFYTDKNDLTSATDYAIQAGNMLEDDDNAQLLMAAAYHDSNNDDKALVAINRVLSRDSLNADALTMRSKINTIRGNYQSAISDIDVMVRNGLMKNPFNMLTDIADKGDDARNLVLNYVKAQRLRDETSVASDDEVDDGGSINWDVIEGLIYYYDSDFKNSLACLERAAKSSSSAALMGILARNYFIQGEVDKALMMYDIANSLQQQSGEGNDKEREKQDYLASKIDVEMKCGMVDQVIHDTKVYDIVNAGNNVASICSALGWAYTAKGQFKDAIKVYDRWAEADEVNITPRYYGARVKALAGMTDEANEDLSVMLDTLDFTGNEELKMCMLYYKGDTDKARPILDRLAANTDHVNAMSDEERDSAEQLPEVVSLYNLACYYSMMGDSERAIDYLRQAYEAGIDESFNFDYAILDSDFDNIRQTPKFVQLVKEYKTRWLNGEMKFKK